MTSFALSIKYIDRTSETLQFNGSRFIVGREVGDIVLRDPQVSGRHGELRIDPTGKFLTYTDLKSSNGSFRANGERIAGTIPLSKGTTLHIGSCVVTVVSIGPQPTTTQSVTSKPPPRGSTVVSRSSGGSSRASPRNPGVVAGSIAGQSGSSYQARENTPPQGTALPSGAALTSTAPPRGRTAPPRTTTDPGTPPARKSGGSQPRAAGTWYEVRAGASNTRTFVMGLSSGSVVIRTQTPMKTGIVETMVVAPGSLGDFDLS